MTDEHDELIEGGGVVDVGFGYTTFLFLLAMTVWGSLMVIVLMVAFL